LTLPFNALTFVERRLGGQEARSEKKEAMIDVRWEEGGKQSDAAMQ
jgi:hypothetical protein